MKKCYFYIVLFAFLSCKNTSETPPHHFVPNSTAEIQETYHEDTTYEYESRTGESGNYQYNYDVSGYDDDGNEVTGNIDIEGKYGEGTLTDSEGNEIDVDVEWIGYGKLRATDDDGNEYELVVD